MPDPGRSPKVSSKEDGAVDFTWNLLASNVATIVIALHLAHHHDPPFQNCGKLGNWKSMPLIAQQNYVSFPNPFSAGVLWPKIYAVLDFWTQESHKDNHGRAKVGCPFRREVSLSQLIKRSIGLYFLLKFTFLRSLWLPWWWALALSDNLAAASQPHSSPLCRLQLCIIKKSLTIKALWHYNNFRYRRCICYKQMIQYF